jgi:hypothetical protein
MSFITVFRHFLLAYLSLQCLKTASLSERRYSNSMQKTPTVTATQKISGVSEKMGVGPNGMRDPHFFA